MRLFAITALTALAACAGPRRSVCFRIQTAASEIRSCQVVAGVLALTDPEDDSTVVKITVEEIR